MCLTKYEPALYGTFIQTADGMRSQQVSAYDKQ